LDLGLLIDAQDHGALGGGLRYSPTTSRTLATNCGSFDSFHVSWRCGCSPKAFQMRCTADRLRPTSAAIDRVDQCVACLGVVFKVLVMTSSTCSSLTVRG
jgi:hypothetical protein